MPNWANRTWGKMTTNIGNMGSFSSTTQKHAAVTSKPKSTSQSTHHMLTFKFYISIYDVLWCWDWIACLSVMCLHYILLSCLWLTAQVMLTKAKWKSLISESNWSSRSSVGAWQAGGGHSCLSSCIESWPFFPTSWNANVKLQLKAR